MDFVRVFGHGALQCKRLRDFWGPGQKSSTGSLARPMNMNIVGGSGVKGWGAQPAARRLFVFPVEFAIAGGCMGEAAIALFFNI